jgi:predicted ribonuclease toxin of YeeF-YezG toxin-antitoxin module
MKIKELLEFKMPDGGGAGGDGSLLLGTIARLLKDNNKIDFKVPGIMGHVVRTDAANGTVIMRKWGTQNSKTNLALPLTRKNDKKFSLVLKGPKHYHVVDAENLKEDLGKPAEVQIEKGLTREEAMKQAPYKKSYGDCRAFSYDKKTGIATWV